MYYSVCISAVFSGKPIQDTLAAVRRAGYDHYEFWGWQDKDIDLLTRLHQELGLTLSVMCVPGVPLNDPEKRQEYLTGLRDTIEVSKRLGCDTFISVPGNEILDKSRDEQIESIVAGLLEAAPLLEKAGKTLVVEPLNALIDHKGIFLRDSSEAFGIIDRVGSAHVKVLFDIYHQHITGEDTNALIRANAEKIGHIHIAGHPGRHEPWDPNEIDLAASLASLKEAGYRRAIGLEYFPLRDAEEGLRVLAERFSL